SFEMIDRNLVINITKGEVPLPSGKVLRAGAGTFTIDDTAAKPLMASVSMKANGEAEAAAEFASFEPIDAMAKAPFAASDLSGSLTGDISAVFGLSPSQDPPKPDFT